MSQFGRMGAVLVLVLMMLALSACSGSYEPDAACGQLADVSPLRDAGINGLQASAEQGRCVIRGSGEPQAVQRQYRMYDALAQIQCGAGAERQSTEGAPELLLRMPAKCPLSSDSTLWIEKDTRWMSERRHIPSYPAAALAQNQHGTVDMRVLVDRDGRPRAAIVAASSGYPLLDEAAANAMRQWRYKRVWWAVQRRPMSLLPVQSTFSP